ncbi:hypothetical protein SPBR_02682 [Sporothrix brasiliensis 5110]|uniref:DJ-1/PfpI domain-containing protein n=1 Tax=Sporothrix brasiliensis 5110 TaxID=1398154 RepID=A0A0C2J5W7_9PEZI|nr:uncharacterized protein SPBR_02682 [Sporothrix brasiliensis 5110]KIH92442.1 hypothetical protein SPBR_02682 [Sporothrix brasiliensis 5110]
MKTFGRSSHVLALGSLLMAGQCGTVRGQTEAQKANANRTLSVGYILFPGFEPLDVFGPLEMIFGMSYYMNMTLATIAETVGPVSARPPLHYMAPNEPPMDLSYMINPQVVATHTFETAPKLDILLVPGGTGNVALEQKNDTKVEDFVRERYPELEYLLSVCTGAITLARSGVLEGRRATSNKGAWAQTATHGKNVTWVPSARWVVDGNVWTSSGVAAGMDMAFAFLRELYGDSPLDTLMSNVEYAPHTDASWDPFSVVHNTWVPVSGAVIKNRAASIVPNAMAKLTEPHTPSSNGQSFWPT